MILRKTLKIWRGSVKNLQSYKVIHEDLFSALWRNILRKWALKLGLSFFYENTVFYGIFSSFCRITCIAGQNHLKECSSVISNQVLSVIYDFYAMRMWIFDFLTSFLSITFYRKNCDFLLSITDFYLNIYIYFTLWNSQPVHSVNEGLWEKK